MFRFYAKYKCTLLLLGCNLSYMKPLLDSPLNSTHHRFLNWKIPQVIFEDALDYACLPVFLKLPLIYEGDLIRCCVGGVMS